MSSGHVCSDPQKWELLIDKAFGVIMKDGDDYRIFHFLNVENVIITDCPVCGKKLSKEAASDG